MAKPVAIRSGFLLGAGLVLAIFLCYLPALRAGFVWDDDLLVTENPLVQGAGSLRYIWASSAATDYTPLTTTAFWLQWRLWGMDPVGYHLVNILLHALAVVVLWRVLLALRVPGAWLGALLFAVHPVNAASVAWIAELKNALSLPFYLVAIAAWLRFLETKRPAPYFIAFAAAAFAMLAKGSTVILPLILLLCEWWRFPRLTLKSLAGLVPFAGLSGAIALVTIHFQSRIIATGGPALPHAEKLARAGQAFWFYIGKDLWPANLCPVYPKWAIGLNFLPLALAAAITIILWLFSHSLGRWPFFAWACFITALLPVLGILQMSFLDQAWVADWWQQLALPAITATAAAGIAALWQRAHKYRAANGALTACVACVIVALGACTWLQASAYQSMETLCRRTLALNPSAWAAHNNLGDALASQGKLDDAMREYQASLRINPANPTAISNLGVADARLGNYGAAIAQYQSALAIEKDSPKTWFNLGNSLRAEHRDAEAAAAFGKAVEQDSHWIAPRYAKGELMLTLGQAPEAGHQAEIIVHLDPASPSGHYLFARAAAAIGRFDVATIEAGKALDLITASGNAEAIHQMQSALDACKAGRQPAAPAREAAK